MISDKALAWLEKNTASCPNDFALRIILANVYFVRNETEKALSILRSIKAESPNSDHGEYATFTLNLNNYFSGADRPYMQYRSYEEIAEAVFEKKVRRNWNFDHISEYLGMLETHAAIKWAPYGMTEVLEFFYHNDEHELAEKAAAAMVKSYPQSWWDARARTRLADIGYSRVSKKIRRLKELARVMEFKKKSGGLQEQGDVNEKLTLETDIGAGIKALDEEVTHLAQRYKNHRFVRDRLFTVVSLYEEMNSERDVIRTLSGVNGLFHEFPEGVKAHFDIGMYYFKTENLQLAGRFFNEHLANYPKSPACAQATFMIGKVLQMQGRSADAMGYYKKTLAIGDDAWKREASASAIEICKSLYQDKKFSDALAMLGEMRSAKFGEEVMAEATFIEGSCNRDMAIKRSGPESAEYMKKAVEIFNHLAERYPDSIFATMAKAALHEIDSGTLGTSIMVNRVSNLIIFSIVAAFFVLLGYSFMNSGDDLYYMILMVQTALIVAVAIFLASYKVLGKFWEILFG